MNAARITLYISARSAASLAALRNLRHIMAGAGSLPEPQIVHVERHPERVRAERVYATPTLLISADRDYRVVGSLDDHDLVRAILTEAAA